MSNDSAPDEWGNVWMDDAVPSGIEIANVMLEIRREFGWQKMWSDYAGLRICPRVRVWLDGYQDRDNEEAFLLRVWTESVPDDDGKNVTVTDHLAVYTGAKLEVEWRQDPRLFFDAVGSWGLDGLRWWVNWLEAHDDVHRETRMSDEARESIRTHNATLEREHRDRARKLGLTAALPYMDKLDFPKDDESAS